MTGSGGSGLIRPRTLLALFALAVALIIVGRQGLALDWTMIWSRMRAANLWLFAAAVAVFYATYVVRGRRWGVLLTNAGLGMAPNTPVLSTGMLTEIIYRAQFVNSVGVGRLGDAFRGYLLKQKTGIPMAGALGTVITERIVDLAVLAVMVALCAPVAFSAAMMQSARSTVLTGVGLVAAAAVLVIVLSRCRVQVAGHLPPKVRDGFNQLVDTVAGSFDRLPVIGAYTLVAWVLEGASIYLIAAAVGAPISVSGAVVVGLVGALLTAIPITPAGLGFAEIGTAALLIGLGVDAAGATAITLLIRLVNYWSIVIVGAALAIARRGI